MSEQIPTFLTNLQQLATEPFHRGVSLAQVAARIESIDLGDSPGSMRASFAKLLLGNGSSAPAGTSLNLGGSDGLLIRPSLDNAVDNKNGASPRLVWFHGGGYVFGSPQTHSRLGAAMAAATGQRVFLPHYRLAPEHPWPAQLEDALAVVRALQDRDQRVALAGDSAGAHLALVTALTLAREQRPVDALALCSPNTDRSGLSATRKANTPRDPMNDDEQDRRLAKLAFGHTPLNSPQLSPLLDDLSLLPPTHIEVGEREVLLDDARLLAQRGQAAGRDISCHIEPDVFHMWQLWTPWLASANASVERIAVFLHKHLG